MVSDSCVMRDGLIASVQEALRDGHGYRLIYVHGISGVGKTTIINEAISRENLTERTESFFFLNRIEKVSSAAKSKRKKKSTEDNGQSSQFKAYLNNLILVRQSRIPILGRLFRREMHIEDGHLSVHAPLS